jgi:hypothetical protein
VYLWGLRMWSGTCNAGRWWAGGLVVAGGLVGRWAGGLVGWWAGGQAGRWAGGLVSWWAGGQVGRWAGGLVGLWAAVTPGLSAAAAAPGRCSKRHFQAAVRAGRAAWQQRAWEPRLPFGGGGMRGRPLGWAGPLGGMVSGVGLQSSSGSSSVGRKAARAWQAAGSRAMGARQGQDTWGGPKPPAQPPGRAAGRRSKPGAQLTQSARACGAAPTAAARRACPLAPCPGGPPPLQMRRAWPAAAMQGGGRRQGSDHWPCRGAGGGGCRCRCLCLCRAAPVPWPLPRGRLGEARAAWHAPAGSQSSLALPPAGSQSSLACLPAGSRSSRRALLPAGGPPH